MGTHAESGTIAGVTKSSVNFRRLGRMEFSTHFSNKPTRRCKLGFAPDADRHSPSVFTAVRTRKRRIQDAGRGRNFLARASAVGTPVLPAPIPALAIRCGRRRLGYRAHGRLWRYVARARPFARIAPTRRLAVATPAALPRSHLRRLLPPLLACRLHSALAPMRRALSLL